MVRTYQAKFGTNGFPGATPDYESAGYYDAVFLLWRLYRDVKAKGGNVNDGAQIQAALEANPTTVGIKGGTATAAGSYQFDLTTHGLKHIPMGFYQVRNGTPVLLATSDIGGTDIKILGLPVRSQWARPRGGGRARWLLRPFAAPMGCARFRPHGTHGPGARFCPYGTHGPKRCGPECRKAIIEMPLSRARPLEATPSATGTQRIWSCVPRGHIGCGPACRKAQRL